MDRPTSPAHADNAAVRDTSRLERLESPATTGYYDGIKSPAVELEGGALRPGGTPTVYSLKHIGLLAHIASISVVYGTIAGVIYSVLNNYLNMSATLVATAQALVKVPHALRMFTGLISDCYPICGYRRRPYMMIGWGLSFICCVVMAVIPIGEPYYGDSSLADISASDYTASQQAEINYDAPSHGIKLIVLFVLAHLGTIVAYGAADGYMVELAQCEPENIRGRLQTHVSMVKYIFEILSAFITGIGLNSTAYGGSFDWDMGFSTVMAICAAFSFVTVPISWFCVQEEKAPGQPTGPFFSHLYSFIQQRVVYQVIAYRFFSYICSKFSVTAASKVKSVWAGVEPLNAGIASMLSALIGFFALVAVRRWGLHWNWRVIVVVCQVAVVVIDCFPTFFTIWDVYRSQWFWLGVPLAAKIPADMGDFISQLFVVEITEPGTEATIIGLIISINNLAAPFATVLYKWIDGYFDIAKKYIVKDDHEVRMQVTYAYIIAYLFNLAAIIFVFWLPRQKAEVHELKRTGGKSKVLGTLTVCYLVFGFLWVVMTNVLSLSTSTSCLRIAGGSGC